MFSACFTKGAKTVGDIQLIIVFAQNHACQGGTNEFFTSKPCFQLLLKWTGLVHATL